MERFLRALQEDGYKDNEIISDDKNFWDTIAPIVIGVSILVSVTICCAGFVLFVKFIIMKDSKPKVLRLEVRISLITLGS